MEIAPNSIEIQVHNPEQGVQNKALALLIYSQDQSGEHADQEQVHQTEQSTKNKVQCQSVSSPAQPDQEQSDEPTSQINSKQIFQTHAEPRGFSKKATKLGRAGIFLVVIGLLVMGRFSVPDNAVACIEDKIQDGLKVANDFINKSENQYARRIMQALCSFCIDVVFISTFIYWIFKGTSWRLPLALGIFYLVRIIVQKFWFMPFPSGFMWDDPGVPSLVVPYGRGSDFYYSGHTGFVTICAKEWHKIGNKTIRNITILIGAYTIMILLIYRIHYSIDVFTGLFFADWCFITIDANKEFIDGLWLKVTLKIYDVLTKFIKKTEYSK